MNRKFKLRIPVACVASALLAASLSVTAATVVERYELVSVSTAGVPASTGSFMGATSVSADGRFVVFSSNDSTIAPNTTKSQTDVYVRDRAAGTTTRVSVAADGSQGSSFSDNARISANGRYVVFESHATNLTSNSPTSTSNSNIYMRDLQTGTTTRISVKFDGSVDNNHSNYTPAVSSDGRYVVFGSDSDLSTIQTTSTNCYIRDTVANTTTILFSGASNGVDCSNPTISGDGRRIAFQSRSSKLGTANNGNWQLVLRDLDLNANILVSADANGNPRAQGNESSSRSVQSAMSLDGRVFAFATTASNLVTGDSNTFQDVFVNFIPRGQSQGTLVRVSTSPDGTVQGNADTPIAQGGRVSLSGNGIYVAYDSSADNLGTYGVSSKNNVLIQSVADGSALTLNVPGFAYQSYHSPVLSQDDFGRFVVFQSGSKLDSRFNSGGIYIYDRYPQTGYWWNPAEPGRGYNIERKGDNLFMAAFLYDVSGRTTWLGIGPSAMNFDNTYAGTLDTYANGQTLTGSFKPASKTGSAGSVSIAFTSGSTGVLTWPGGTLPIQRYDFGPTGTGAAAAINPAGTPEAGWWWAPSEGGRGYAIEVQGGQLFLAGYMYDAQGNPLWYASGPTPLTGLTGYTGAWAQFGNGQTLTGAYKVAGVINANVGAVNIQFSSTTTGTLTFPDGRQVAISRFPF